MAGLAGISRPTTFRYASTLVRLGFLEQSRAHKYLLAPGSADPGSSVIAAMQRALPVRAALQELHAETGYTVSLGALNSTSVTYVYRLYGHRCGQHFIDQEIRLGAHVPVYCTALGRALLASLSEASRRQLIEQIDFIPQGPRSILSHSQLLDELASVDYREPIVSDEEFIGGARSIAIYVPRSYDERRIAIDVTVPSVDYTVNQLLRGVGPQLMYAAKLIAQIIGA